MHPIIQTEIMNARTAERHRRADQARLAQAAKQGRRAIRQHGASRVLRRLRLRLRPVPVPAGDLIARREGQAGDGLTTYPA